LRETLQYVPHIPGAKAKHASAATAANMISLSIFWGRPLRHEPILQVFFSVGVLREPVSHPDALNPERATRVKDTDHDEEDFPCACRQVFALVNAVPCLF
jgi:hypothetical protein